MDGAAPMAAMAESAAPAMEMDAAKMPMGEAAGGDAGVAVEPDRAQRSSPIRPSGSVN